MQKKFTIHWYESADGWQERETFETLEKAQARFAALKLANPNRNYFLKMVVEVDLSFD